MKKPLNVLVIGAGAIGSFYGWKLAQAGANVSIVSRTHSSLIQKNGVAIDSPLGNGVFHPTQVLNATADYAGHPDVVLVATKVLPSIDIVGLLSPVIGPKTSLLLIQNGLDIESPIAAAFPQNTVIGGLAFICVSRTSPISIVHQSYGRLSLGTFPKGGSIAATQLAELFKTSGISCNVIQDLITERWRKLVWNAPFNPISVLAGGKDTLAILENPHTLTLTRSVMREVMDLAFAAGHPLPDNLIKTNVDYTLSMGPYKTSMLLDFEAGRSLETDAILGRAIQSAERLKISVPHMVSLHALLSHF